MQIKLKKNTQLFWQLVQTKQKSFGYVFSFHDNVYSRAKMWTETHCQPQMCCQRLGGATRGEDSWACTGGTVCAVCLDCHSGADGEIYTQGVKTHRRGDSRETSEESLDRWTGPDFRERNRTSLLSSFAENKYLLLSSWDIAGSSEKEQMLWIILTVKLIEDLY